MGYYYIVIYFEKPPRLYTISIIAAYFQFTLQLKRYEPSLKSKATQASEEYESKNKQEYKSNCHCLHLPC